MSSLSSERQTILFVTAALAIFLLITGINPDIGKTRTPTRNLAAGKTIPVSITLVTADARDLACAGDVEVGGARCGFAEDGSPWSGAAEKPVLAPYMTVDNVMFLVPDLWKEPALARRLAADPPDVPRKQLRRFTAKCDMKVLEKAKSFYVRWEPHMDWSHTPEAWVGAVSGCSID